MWLCCILIALEIASPQVHVRNGEQRLLMKEKEKNMPFFFFGEKKKTKKNDKEDLVKNTTTIPSRETQTKFTERKNEQNEKAKKQRREVRNIKLFFISRPPSTSISLLCPLPGKLPTR